MKQNLQNIINEWIGQDEEVPQDTVGYAIAKSQNSLRKLLRANSPDLAEKIIKEVEEEIEKKPNDIKEELLKLVIEWAKEELNKLI